MASKHSVKPLTFEQCLQRLEQIVEQLERGDIPLEDSIKIYEEGITLSKQCLEKLSQAEVRLKTLEKDAQGKFRLFVEEPDEND